MAKGSSFWDAKELLSLWTSFNLNETLITSPNPKASINYDVFTFARSKEALEDCPDWPGTILPRTAQSRILSCPELIVDKGQSCTSMVCLHLQVSESTALMFQELEGKEDERGVARQTMIDYAKAAMEDQGGEVDNLKDVTKADLFKATEDVELEWVIPGELPTSYMLKAIKKDVEDEESEQWAMTVE